MHRFVIVVLAFLFFHQVAMPQDHSAAQASGIDIERIKVGSGSEPIFGDQVSVHLIVTPLPGKKETINTYERGRPATFRLGSSGVIFGLELLLYEMKPGAIVKARLPYSLAYGASGNPPTVPPRSDVSVRVELVGVEHMEIKDHYTLKQTDTIFGSKGLKWIEIIDLPGVNSSRGQLVSVHYTAYYSNGKPFESSRLSGEPIEFKLGDPSIIRGWNMALEQMSPGERWRLIVPYKLAYGNKGMPPRVPPKANLIFDIELVSVK